MEGYSATITWSSKELSAKERVALKSTAGCIPLDEATKNANITITPDYWAEVAIHNERGEDKDYNKYIIVDKDGNRYVTGSQSFHDAFCDIWAEMDGEDEEWSVVVFRQPSKNYKGKEFLTCNIV